jgi:hypothetical protein
MARKTGSSSTRLLTPAEYAATYHLWQTRKTRRREVEDLLEPSMIHVLAERVRQEAERRYCDSETTIDGHRRGDGHG